jgi:hypothetical protein
MTDDCYDTGITSRDHPCFNAPINLGSISARATNMTSNYHPFSSSAMKPAAS